MVKALENCEGTLTGKTGGNLSTSRQKPQEQTDGIPIVRNIVTNVGGMLDERQQTWTAGLPNEASIENPVLYK